MNTTSLLRFYARRRIAFLDKTSAADLQQKQLFELLRKAANTKFGLEHGFSKIKTVAQYQRQVPLRSYEQFWQDYWSKTFPIIRDLTWPGIIKYFALSSGTSSGKTKYIPYTPEMTASNNRAGIDVLCHHVALNPHSNLISGKSFILGGSTDLKQLAQGVWCGDLSGISTRTMPSWVKACSFPPARLALIKSWEEKILAFASALPYAKIRSMAGLPSWMLVMIKQLLVEKNLTDTSGALARLFPNLELIIHGGVNFSPYRAAFSQLLRESSTQTREVYPASEGWIASADQDQNQGLRLNLDHGIFFEFVALDELGRSTPTRLLIEQVELNKTYAIILSTCAGLWSYIIGDTVKFVCLTPPRLVVSGRTSYSLSAFGEHLTAEEIDKALSSAAIASGLSFTEYALAPIFPESATELGQHVFVVEFDQAQVGAERLQYFGACMDQTLAELNEDYAAHRADGFGLAGPRLLVMRQGGFAAWMKSRGKLGGQNKVPRIITDLQLRDSLLAWVRSFV